jgi:hypothetical protein
MMHIVLTIDSHVISHNYAEVLVDIIIGQFMNSPESSYWLYAFCLFSMGLS